jgi:hypothetical protein
MISRLAWCRTSTRTAGLGRPLKTFARGLSSSAPPPVDQKKDEESFLAPLLPYIKTSGTGVGQVIFLNSHVSGGIIMGGLALGDPYLASLATLGTITATGTAQFLGLDSSALKDGLWGYNGCLVGCAAAVFGPTNIVAASTACIPIRCEYGDD